ncbi:MAG TPA: lyase [Croceibacterium sp.]|nr:lyase [Croceibacterium sp.]
MRSLLIAAALGLGCTAACARAQDSASAQASAAKYQTRVFEVPAGSRPHDASPGPEGKIWYTGQRRGTLGIIDIASGEVREVPLGEGSAPHGVVLGPDGKAWITDGGQNAIVRYDPASESIDVWKLPADSGYTNLNTGAFDKDGVHWFTGQNGIYGRADASGQVAIWKDPEGRGAYGIDDTPDGEIWYVSLAGSHLAKVGRADGSVTIVQPPDENPGLRRVWADSKGDLWITGWNNGKLYRYRPADGSWASWMLPGDKPQAYAVYVDQRDDVWVTDFASNNTLVFDIASETFVATIPGSGPNAQVRQILGRGNEIYLPESGLDRLMLVTVAE